MDDVLVARGVLVLSFRRLLFRGKCSTLSLLLYYSVCCSSIGTDFLKRYRQHQTWIFQLIDIDIDVYMIIYDYRYMIYDNMHIGMILFMIM